MPPAKRHLLPLLVLSASLFRPQPLAAEPVPYALYNTEVRTLHSDLVGIDYNLYVSLPRGYEVKTASYPVVLVLDPDYFFSAVHHAALVLADHDELQPMILVGIAYPGGIEGGRGDVYKRNRTRDYTPTFVASGGYGAEFQKQSGGADKFLDFMARELIPHLERSYRIKKDDRTLIGISYGGLLASYALLTRPGLFQRMIVVSPSLWYDRHALSRIEEKAAAAGKGPAARVYFSVGGRETHGEPMVKDLDAFVKKLQSRNYPGLRTRLWIAPEETHHTVFPGAAMRGLQWVFKGE